MILNNHVVANQSIPSINTRKKYIRIVFSQIVEGKNISIQQHKFYLASYLKSVDFAKHYQTQLQPSARTLSINKNMDKMFTFIFIYRLRMDISQAPPLRRSNHHLIVKVSSFRPHSPPPESTPPSRQIEGGLVGSVDHHNRSRRELPY